METDSSKIIIGLIALTVIVSGCLGILDSESEETSPESGEEPINGEQTEANGDETSPVVVHENISEEEIDREIHIEGENFEWTPDEIEVEQGEVISLRVESLENGNDFEITNHTEPMFVEGNEEEVKTVTFEEPGSYDFRCTIFGDGGMTGTIEVS